MKRFLFPDHTEVNASTWDSQEARELRIQLFEEHIGADATPLSPRKACEVLRRFRRIARAKSKPGFFF